MRLILAPKSARAFFIDRDPMEQGKVKLPGSSTFFGNPRWVTTEHSSPRVTRPSSFFRLESNFKVCAILWQVIASIKEGYGDH